MNPESTVYSDSNNVMNNYAASWDTLEEPIWDTISRDISSIGFKLKYILMPLSESEVYVNVCKNWDLWGPFIFCAYIAFSLNNCGGDCTGYHQSNFSSIFVLLWIGNILISLNYKLLLNDKFKHSTDNLAQPTKKVYPMSIFQLLCLFGYCLAIPSIGILIIQVLSLFLSDSSILNFYEKLLVVFIFGFVYPVLSAFKMLSNNIQNDKYFLVTYPIMMFFLMLSFYLYTYA